MASKSTASRSRFATFRDDVPRNRQIATGSNIGKRLPTRCSIPSSSRTNLATIGANAAAGRLVARDQNAIASAEDAALFSPEVACTIIQADRVAFETGQPQSYQLAVGDGADAASLTPSRRPS